MRTLFAVRSLQVASFAALALAAACGNGNVTLNDTAACNGTVYRSLGGHYLWQCYYLPTVANGRVTGVEQHINHHVCRQVMGSGRHGQPHTICN